MWRRALHRVLATTASGGFALAVALTLFRVIGAHPEDWNRHRLLRAIALNTTLSALLQREIWPRESWLRPATDLAWLDTMSQFVAQARCPRPLDTSE